MSDEKNATIKVKFGPLQPTDQPPNTEPIDHNYQLSRIADAIGGVAMAVTFLAVAVFVVACIGGG